MKLSLRWVFVALSIVTIVWSAALYVTLQQYHEYVEWYDEHYGEWGLREPYYAWNGGFYVAIIGVSLLFAWIVFGVCCLYPLVEKLPHKEALATLLLIVVIVALVMWGLL